MSQFSVPSLAATGGLEFLWEYLYHHPAHERDAALANSAQLAFLGHCVEHVAHSHAQLLQDLFVLYRTQCKRNGYFVEFGATDGLTLSNTCLLERRYGWTGILAEPYPVWHAALAANRRAAIDHRCIWSSSGKKMAFIASREMELAGLRETAEEDMHAGRRSADAGEIEVVTVSLIDLLEQHGAPRDIDYLSVDTEGSEFDILSAFDFSRYRIRIISVEHNYMETKREAIRQLLAQHGYQREFEAFSNWDDWYVRPDIP